MGELVKNHIQDKLLAADTSKPLEALSTLSQCLLRLEDGSGATGALDAVAGGVSAISAVARSAGRADIAELCDLGEQILSALTSGSLTASLQVTDALLEMCDVIATIGDLGGTASEKREPDVATLADKLRALLRNVPTGQSPPASSVTTSPSLWPGPACELDPALVGQFKEESAEGLQMLEAVLLEFERTPHDLECVHAIFRVVHNIKGAADFVGLAQIKTLSHRLEDLLDLLRSGRHETTAVISDLVFRSVDELRAMIASLTPAGEQNRELTELVSTLLAMNHTATALQASGCNAVDSAEDLAVYVDSAEQQLESIAACCVRLVSGDASDAMLITLRRAVTTLMAAAAYLEQTPLPEPADELLQVVQTLRDARNHVQKQLAAANAEHLANQSHNLERSREESQLALRGPDLLNSACPGQADELNSSSITACCSKIAQGDASAEVLDALNQAFTALGEIAARSGMAELTEAAKVFQQDVEDFGQACKCSQEKLRALSSDGALHDRNRFEPRQVDAASVSMSPEIPPTTATPPQTPAASPPAAERDGRSPAGTGTASKTMRVDQGKLDEYIALAGELVIARNALVHEFGQCRIDATHHHGLKESVERVQRIVADIQVNAMSMRMIPAMSVFQRFPRMVRDLAKAQGKQIEIRLFGEETELDKQVAEKLGDPLVHLIRNSADHGIELPEDRLAAGKREVGTITLKAGREGSAIIIDIIDDGRGIDVARLKAKAVEKGVLRQEQADVIPREKALELIFAAGLSTAKVVSDISGRGVGMDVVRSNIMDLGGAVSVLSEDGKGSQIRLELPLTLAVTTVVLASAGDCLYAIPMESVKETVKVPPQTVGTLNGRYAISLRGRVVPIVPLTEVLSSHSGGRGAVAEYPEALATDRSGRVPIVVVAIGAAVYGISVAELRGQQEIVVKPLPSQLGQLPGIGGATIMGDGSVVLILDPASLSDFVTSSTSRGERDFVNQSTLSSTPHTIS